MRIILLTLLLAAGAHADWKGTLAVSGTRADGGPADQGISLSGKGAKLRVEIRREDNVLKGIVDRERSRIDWLDENGRTFEPQVMDSEHIWFLGGGFPAGCGSLAPAACMKKNGFRRTGKARIAGHPVTRWQRTAHIVLPPDLQQLLWIADDSPELIPLQGELHNADGRVTRFSLTSLQLTSQPDSDFEIPKGYSDMTKRPIIGGGDSRHGSDKP